MQDGGSGRWRRESILVQKSKIHGHLSTRWQARSRKFDLDRTSWCSKGYPEEASIIFAR